MVRCPTRRAVNPNEDLRPGREAAERYAMEYAVRDNPVIPRESSIHRISCSANIVYS